MGFTQIHRPDQSRTWPIDHSCQKIEPFQFISTQKCIEKPENLSNLIKIYWLPSHRLCQKFFLLTIFLFHLQPTSGTDIYLPEKDSRQILSWHIVKSKDKRIIVIGPVSHHNTFILKCIEEIRTRLEKLTGMKLSLNSSEIHISVRPKEQSSPTDTKSTADSDKTSPESSSIVSWVEQGKESLLMRVVLSGYENIEQQNIENMEKTICSLLIYAVCFEQTNFLPASFTPASIPSWFIDGIVRNLYPERKAENINEGLKYWYEGKIPPPHEFLADNASHSRSSQFPEYVSSLFVAWLASFPNKKQIFENICKRLAEQKPLTAEWLIGYIPECIKNTDLTMAWDKWLFSQKYVVYEPGIARMFHITELRNLLLIRANEIGNAFITDKQFLSLRELIPLSKQYNLKDFCAMKINALKILSAGKGKEFGNVIDLYCEFFAELARASRTEHLISLLEKADRTLSTFTETLKKQQSSPTPP